MGIVRQTCESFEIRIIRGVVSKDHVHIAQSIVAGRRDNKSDFVFDFESGKLERMNNKACLFL